MFRLKKKHVVWGIIVLALFMLFPLFVNYLVMSWSAINVHGDTNAWLGFISSYYGSLFSGLVGGLFTFAAIYLGFYKNESDKFLESYDAKEFVLKENIELLSREFINIINLAPNTALKLKYYYARIELLNDIYENTKFVVGSDSAWQIKLFVSTYSTLKNKSDSEGNVYHNHDIDELCNMLRECISAIYLRLDEKRKALKEQKNIYKKQNK